MGDLTKGLGIFASAAATVFVYFGILLGYLSLLGRLSLRRVGGASGRPPLWEQEREIVALFSAVYTQLPRVRAGEYVLRLGGEERTLRVSAWSSDRGIVEAAGRSLEVRIRGEDRALGLPQGDATDSESRARGGPEGDREGLAC